MNDALNQLQQRIGHEFRDATLLETAVTHPSWLQALPLGDPDRCVRHGQWNSW